MKAMHLLILLVLIPVATLAAPDFAYDDYAAVLKSYVNQDGFVDYAGLKADRDGLDRFVDALAQLDKPAVEDWTEKEQLAFWINAYNALTLKAVVDHFPVESIKDIGSPLKSVWDKLTFEVAGRTLTLNQIEHSILREEFKEPYIHLAINCASIGCPPLLNTPYTAERLAGQFNDQTVQFLAAPRNFAVAKDGSTVSLSSIFKWFGGDFVAKYGADPKRKGLSAKEDASLNFVVRHLDPEDRERLEGQVKKVRFLPYDWNLNRQE